MKLSNTWYDRLKWVVLVLLPAVGALYFSLAGWWGFPKVEEVVGTLAVVATFLGSLIGVSTLQYNKTQE